MNNRISTTARKCSAILLPVLLAAACTVGPEYKKPAVTGPDQFRYQIQTSEARSFADLPWWGVFNDAALQALINEALTNNPDLTVAVARIEEARARVGQVESEGKPQVGYEATAAGEKSFIPQAGSKAKAFTYGNFEGLLTAAWELDIWGRIQHATESAKAQLLEQEDVRRGVVLILVSDVAADYFGLLALDRELAIAQESSTDYKRTLDLFTARYEGGRDSKLPVERAQAAYDSANAQIQDVNRRIGLQENAIAVLLGAYPKPAARGQALEQQTMPQTPLGATTALLQRRPEILAAEQEMISANAQIGEAVASFYPRVGLSAFLGGEGVSIANSFTGFGVWNLAATLAGPIYTGGLLEEQYNERKAYWDESVASYKEKILVAFQETSDALIAQQTLVGRRTALESQVAAQRQSVDFALERYQGGRASYFEVLEAQQELFPAEQTLAETQRDQLLAVVNLYKALGGGWYGPAGEQTEPGFLPTHTASAGG
ncbi:MAG TPA: efflux transporter outer membrane subunit [Rhizomicrobium sp.]|nr:efflux transporter outer membrane subunit [Rhizomicrobium sp.]